MPSEKIERSDTQVLKIGFGGNTEEETFLVLDEPTITQENKNTHGTCSKKKNVSGEERSVRENKQQKTPRAHKMPISIQRDKTNKTFTSKTTF
jgi:hypothetical protein